MKPNSKQTLKALILDMDGVLWRDDDPIVDLKTVFADIARHDLKVTLATNNATLSIQQYQDKLGRFGISLEPWQIVNSTLAVIRHLDDRFPNKGRVYVIGEEGLTKTLNQHGYRDGEENVVAVIVALDRHLTFEKLRRATLLIRSGVEFIGTNPDRTFPTPGGLIPGAGAILAALEASTEVMPLIAGKPSPEMYKIAMERMGASPEETLVVGDRLETDIAGAQALGCRSALVLSGVTDRVTAMSWSPAPDFIEPNLASLIEKL